MEKRENKSKKWFYACLESKEGIVKIPFETRDEARYYIQNHFDPKWHNSCWTE